VICEYDCFNCVYDDCIVNSLKSQWKYNNSEKGKLRQIRYNQSEKGKARQKRYDQSEKGKEKIKRARANRIKNGKNAEACRRYRERKKAKLLDTV
jgi:hypothetical protein